jgi:hypothetical protein
MKKQRENKPIPANGSELRSRLKSHDTTGIMLGTIRDAIDQLPKRDQLRVLVQLDSLREEVAERVKARL